jgi:hypothetical protein
MSDSPILPPPPPMQPGGWNAVGPYATSAMPVPQLRPLAGLATALTVLLSLAALVSAFGAWAMFSRAGLFDDAANGIFGSFDEATAADDRVTGAIAVHFLGFAATGIVFIVWQFRHAKNAQVLGARGGLGPGWAIGGWFVPIANYVLPALQMHQSSRASDLDGRRQGTRGRGSGVVVLWAIAFGLASLVFAVGGAMAPADDTGFATTIEDLEDSASSDRMQAAGFGLYAVAALVAIAMVRELSARQATTYAAMAAATSQALAGATSASPPPPSEAAAWGATSPDWAAKEPPRVYEPPPSTAAPVPPSSWPAPPVEPTIPPPPGAPPPPPPPAPPE